MGKVNGFKNCNIYIENIGVVKSDLEIKNNKIFSFNSNQKDLISLSDEYIIVPGFIDKHIHGANNSDVMYPTIKDLENICTSICKEGVTSFLGTTMTQSEENIINSLKNINDYIKNHNKKGSCLLGVHLEGPFISKKHKGAQSEEYIIPCSVEKFKVFEEASGNNIKQVTLAYEENGKELVNYLRNKNIVASLGHTDATALQVKEAILNGVTSATHTFNAMKPLHHREAGTVGGVINNCISCELICDLVHVSEEAVKLLYNTKGQNSICLITDALEAKHLSDGLYNLGGQEVRVIGKEARLSNGTLAGSTLKMNDAIKNAKNVLGISFEKAIDLASINPARVLKLDHLKGSINIGKDADLVIVDKEFNVYATIVAGEFVYKNGSFI